MTRVEVAKAVTEIARSAGAAILSIYHNVDDMQVALKDDHSPVTIADRAANDIICSGLSLLPEKHPIIAEESRQAPFEERRHYHTYWLVDPLDGTKEFLKKNGEFAVNIALIEAGRPVLGVVFDPCVNEIYWAVKGEGAWLERNGHTKQLHAATFRMTDPGLKVTCSRSHLNEATQAYLAKLNAPVIIPKGSALKFLLVASGEVHLYPRIGQTSEWDTGAAQIIVEEAGGALLDFYTRKPLVYNKEVMVNPDFITYGKLEGPEILS
ncbi:MAG: 3'(2'),5'-bisphosphate nucleotidase CysQ [Saprospiraceae bacterium]|nr:3'(2'),5'-bisphosphate nucleotidase CysQ [Saprospiraceae bacterium]